MDVPALIDHALEAVDHNQAELARKVGRSQTTVSRWRTGQTGIDYESALRLVPVTGLPAHTILTTAGLDPSLMGAAAPTAPAPLPNLLQRYVGRHCRDMGDVNDMIERMPEHYWKDRIERILGRAEFDIRDEVTTAFRLYTAESEAQLKGKVRSRRVTRHPVSRRLITRSTAHPNAQYVPHLTVSKVEPPRNNSLSLGIPQALLRICSQPHAYSAVALTAVGCARGKGIGTWKRNTRSR